MLPGLRGSSRDACRSEPTTRGTSATRRTFTRPLRNASCGGPVFSLRLGRSTATASIAFGRSLLSGTFARATVTPNGSPSPSISIRFFVSDLTRSAGILPVFPPNRALLSALSTGCHFRSTAQRSLQASTSNRKRGVLDRLSLDKPRLRPVYRVSSASGCRRPGFICCSRAPLASLWSRNKRGEHAPLRLDERLVFIGGFSMAVALPRSGRLTEPGWRL